MWTQEDRTLVVEIPEIEARETYVVAEDNVALVSDSGARYEQRDCY